MKHALGLLAAIAAGVSQTAAFAEAVPSPFFIELGNIELVDCGTRRGSGVRIDETTILTAAHVVSGVSCTIDGLPVENVHVDGERDLAVVRTINGGDTRTAINCEGFQKGRTYFAVGWVGGKHLVVQRVHAAGGYRMHGQMKGLAHLRGLTFPGMSGGAIVDENGQEVGIVNAGNPFGIVLSRELKGTYLCGDES